MGLGEYWLSELNDRKSKNTEIEVTTPAISSLL